MDDATIETFLVLIFIPEQIVLITNHNIQRIFIVFSPIWSSVRVPIFMDFINNFIALLTIQIRIHKVTFILHFINIVSFFCVILLSFARNFFGLSISGALNFITIHVIFFIILFINFFISYFFISFDIFSGGSFIL